VPEISGPGCGDPFDPWDLDDVRERVVRPVVAALVRPADLRRVEVRWGPGEAAVVPVWHHGDEELWALVEAAGSTWASSIWQLEAAEQLETLADVAWRLADQLEDWVSEDLYRGEQALARAVIPARRP
jgi:hypothetical protein